VSWPIWTVAALLLTAFVTVRRARTPPRYEVDVIIRASEGPMRAKEQLGGAALRAHVRDLTFTRARLIELMRSVPEAFPGAGKDPDSEIEDLRERMKVDIVTNDVIDEEDNDTPRSARIHIEFAGGKPEATWKGAHALADLLIDSALARQRAALLREQTGAELAEEGAADDSEPAAGRSAAMARLVKETEAQAAAARLGLRAAEEQQALRFELVDPGRIPTPVGRAKLVRDAFVTLAVLLLVACLLAGAFDPRVLDAGDLAAAGVPLLGRLPSLPDRGRPGPTAAEPAEPTSAPSGDPGPRV
jgi:hypothetical protein